MPAFSIQGLLFIAAVCIAIGCALGFLVASLRGNSNESRSAPAGDKTPPEQDPQTQRPMLRLSRDLAKGSLIVRLGDNLKPSAEGLTLDERKQLVDLLHETMTWAGIPPQAEMPLRTEPAPPVLSAAGSDPRSPEMSGPNPALTPVAEPARPSVLGGVTNALADVINPTAPKKEELKSIVQQIDEILQEKLMSTELAGEKIGLIEDPRKGVVVRVGTLAYEGIGSVPEGLVKDLLKASVQEWEKRQEIAKRRSTIQ